MPEGRLRQGWKSYPKAGSLSWSFRIVCAFFFSSCGGTKVKIPTLPLKTRERWGTRELCLAMLETSGYRGPYMPD
jgi:hypothetical protein